MTPPIETSSPNPSDDQQINAEEFWSRLGKELAGQLSPSRFAGVKIVLGVSGGADSVAMLRLIADLWRQHPSTDSRNLIVAHYNHRLRGEASDTDQQFVAELASFLSLPFHTASAEWKDETLGQGGEAAFRKARYRFLEAAALAVGARYVMVAHTAEDNIETVLHNLFRGTGSAGLAGIAKHRSLGADLVLVRPMREMRRNDLREGLKAIGQPWREDASNLDARFQRNWLRGQLLPLIRERYPSADDAILRMIESQSQQHAWLCEQAKDWIKRYVIFLDGMIVIQKASMEPAMVAMVVHRLWDQMNWPRQGLTAKHLRRLRALITRSKNESFTLPGDVQAIDSNDTVTLRRERKKRHSSMPLR